MRKEVIISIEDLRHICIECPHCHAKVILDMQQSVPVARAHGMFAPANCPGCEASYDSAIKPNVDQLQRIYAALSAIADRISFRAEATEGPRDL